MTSLKSFSNAVENFKTSFKSGRWESCKKELNKLKSDHQSVFACLDNDDPIAVVEWQSGASFVVCCRGDRACAFESSNIPSLTEGVVLGEVLEHAVLLSVKLEDEDSFERNFLQLETYYFDQNALPPSEKQSLMLGLHLMLLLVQKRTAEFHMELERIPSHLHENDVYVKYAIELEQRLMEGSYHKALTSKDDLPTAEYYRYFIDQLETTVREEIASCCEKAYTKLKVPDAAKLMMVESVDEMVRYAEDKMKVDVENGGSYGVDSGNDVVMAGELSLTNHGSAWGIQDGEIHFKPDLHPDTQELSSLDIIKRTLMYARELERIV